MIKFGALHIHTERPGLLADFYQEVLQTDPEMANDDIITFNVDEFRLIVMRHSEVSGRNPDAARMMFDLWTDDVQGEFERVASLGADVIQEPYEMDTPDAHLEVATLADPDGNLFQFVNAQPAS